MENTIKIKSSLWSWFWAYTAFILSWTVNKSIGWGIFHFIFSGIYVPYWLLRYSPICEMISNFCDL